MRLFDSHLHIIDPQFPLVPNDGYVPNPFTVEDYQTAVGTLAVQGGAVISGSFQAFDTTYLLNALRQLGPAFVGVAQLPPDVSDRAILALDGAGVRAVRFNLRRGGSAGLDALPRLAQRVWDLAGWHAELYIDSRELPAVHSTLRGLPRIVIDHLGLAREGFAQVLSLVENGAFVKATGFGRTDLDVPIALRQLAQANPNAILFGTDLPSTRAPRPFHPEDLQLIHDTFDDALADAILYRNAVSLYRPITSH